MRLDGGKYSVWRARGPLFVRQQEASAADCVAYVEQHANAAPANSGKPAQYSMAIIAENASPKALAWGRSYTARVARELGIPDRGVLKYDGRGSYNVRYTTCPAILVEPGFLSDPKLASVIATGEVIDALARCLVDSIVEHFGPGLVGLSVGHMYRAKPDSGALFPKEALTDPEFDTEAELNDAIINTAEEMLLALPRLEAPNV